VSQTILAYYADGIYVGMALISACCARRADPDMTVIVYSPQKYARDFPDWIEHRPVDDEYPQHYIRKPRSWLHLLSCAGDREVVLLDADTVPLASLHEGIKESHRTGLAAVVDNSSYMQVHSSTVELRHDHARCRSDLGSRLDICPDSGAELKSFFNLPEQDALNRRPYFGAAFLFVRRCEKVIQMFQRTSEFGIAHPNARALAILPENTPMNCAAMEADISPVQLDPEKYSLMSDTPGKVILHMDGPKRFGRRVSRDVGRYREYVEQALSREHLLHHPMVQTVW